MSHTAGVAYAGTGGGRPTDSAMDGLIVMAAGRQRAMINLTSRGLQNEPVTVLMNSSRMSAEGQRALQYSLTEHRSQMRHCANPNLAYDPPLFGLECARPLPEAGVRVSASSESVYELPHASTAKAEEGYPFP